MPHFMQITVKFFEIYGMWSFQGKAFSELTHISFCLLFMAYYWISERDLEK